MDLHYNLKENKFPLNFDNLIKDIFGEKCLSYINKYILLSNNNTYQLTGNSSYDVDLMFGMDDCQKETTEFYKKINKAIL